MSTRPGAAAPEPTPRPHRWLVRALLLTATVLAVVAIACVWANRQVLDASNWADTSTELLDDPEIRSQVAEVVSGGVQARVARVSTRFQREPSGGNGSPAAPAADRLGQLERLASLHERGVLSDDEYAAEKAAILGAHGRPAPAGS